MVRLLKFGTCPFLNMAFDVNTAAIIHFTDRLENLSRSAFPNAVRATLNNAAFETKKEVPRTASSQFTIRNRNFFRSMTLVNKAGGFNINSMQSEVGISNVKNKVAEGLETQERGGSIKDRAMIATDSARTSNSNNKQIRKVNYLTNIRLPKSKKKGSGTGFVKIKTAKGEMIFATKSGAGKKNLGKAIYSYAKNRSVGIKRTPFMQIASEKIQLKMPEMYVKAAEREIQKYMR